MSLTLEQIYALNPSTTINDTDLFYLVQSPYTPGTDSGISGLSLKSVFVTIPGSTSLTTLGTITTGTWNATTIGAIYGGTGLTSYTLGDMLYASAANTLARLAGNITATKNFLSQTGTGVVSAAPVWSTISASDIGSGQALTRVDDTNVTLTLGGTPATSLLQAVSLTLGWTGTLSGTRGGTGVNNGANTVTYAGNLNFAGAFTTSGAFAVTQTYTGITNVTFPTSGTLATTSQLPTPAALTRVDDTNVTLTLGGTPATALLQAVSLTLGWTGVLSGTRGGTGVNNGANTITLGGSIVTGGAHTLSGAFASTFTFTGITSVTFPTSGTLATTAQLPTPAALTKTDDTNVTLTLGGTPATALLQATSLTLGWTGTLSGTRGGTGVNNGASTITLGGSLTTSGAFASTFTMTNTTSVTFPTSGTLATTSQIPTGAALTKVDDTNVTLTLGGSPSTALINAASLTLGWTGTLSGTRGGTGVNNGASTITIGGNVEFSGAFTFTGTLTANTSVTFPTSGTLLTSASINAYEAEGRLTLTTNTPVTTADVTAATTLYYTPYVGDHIALFDGSSTWTTITFSQISIAVPATTVTMYDVFIYNNSGTATLELTAWTNDTTRATALVYQNGILVKSGATTRRYVGSMRTTGSSGQTEDSAAKRFVWNYYNRIARQMKVVDTTDTWTYSTASYRQANNSTANQLDFIIGVQEDSIVASVVSSGYNSTSTIRPIKNGIGLDSTTVTSSTKYNVIYVTNAASNLPTLGCILSEYNAYPGIGRHFLAWLEFGAGSDTQTWVGDNGAAVVVQSGISGIIWG